MHERVGLRGVRRKLEKEAGQWAELIPELPRLIHSQLSRPDVAVQVLHELREMRRARSQGNRLLMALTGVAALSVIVAFWALSRV